MVIARILVLGSRGMLGHMVLRHLSKDPSLFVEGTQRRPSPGRLAFDAETGRKGLLALLGRRPGYSYLINCIGVTKPGIDLNAPASVRQAIVVNALFPHDLAAAAEETGARVIHISTDGVFSGKADFYDEDSLPDCTDLYGRTKHLGEARAPGFLTLRCSVIGPDPARKSGLLEWFLGQPEGANLEGFEDHMWNGVTTLQFAELCRRIIVENRFQVIRTESPLHHFCPNRPVSKYELLLIFRSTYRKRTEITRSKEPTTPVRRILASRFLGLRDLFGEGRYLEEAVKELAESG